MKKIISKTTPLALTLLPALSYGATLEKPNVLFLFVDDLTYDCLNVLGNHEVISPNLDALVESGVRFTNCHNMGSWSGAVSIASRSQLMTGQFLWNTNEQSSKKYAEAIAANDMMPEVMEKNGYKTFHTGKWHMAHIVPDDIFQEVGTVRPGMAPVMPQTHPHAYDRPQSKDDNDWKPWNTLEGGYWSGGKHWSEVVTDEALAYLDANKDDKQPLFMYCAYNAPHDPKQSPKEYLDMYSPEKLTVPESFLPENAYGELTGEGRACRDEALAPFPRTEYAIQKHRQEYYALITHLDNQIGRIFSYLKENGLYEKTFIVFSADHGLALGKHGFMGKQNLYEHSTKPPLVFAGPGVPKGQSRDQLVYMQDLVPTIFDYVGIDTPERYDFESVLDIINDKKEDGRDALYGAFQKSQRMVRNERYKLYFLVPYKKVLLFDLKKDPQEMHDLYGNAKYKEIVKDLAKEYLELAEESGDKFDITSIYPEIFSGLK